MMLESIHDDDLIQTGTASQILGISPSAVQLLERTGKLTARRTDRGVRLFRRADVERFAHERERRRAAASPMPEGSAA